MNVRTLLIIAGLALPVVAFAILSQSMPNPAKTNALRNDASTNDIAEQATSQDTAAEDTNPQQPEPQVADVSEDAGQIPEGVKPGPMSVSPVILPTIGAEEQQQAPARDPNAMTLQQAVDKTKSRLAYLEKMHPGEWPEERKRHRNAPATLQEALNFNRTRLAKLATMTEAQWDQEQRQAAARLRQRWQAMSPAEQMRMHQESKRLAQ